MSGLQTKSRSCASAPHARTAFESLNWLTKTDYCSTKVHFCSTKGMTISIVLLQKFNTFLSKILSERWSSFRNLKKIKKIGSEGSDIGRSDFSPNI